MYVAEKITNGGKKPNKLYETRFPVFSTNPKVNNTNPTIGNITSKSILSVDIFLSGFPCSRRYACYFPSFYFFYATFLYSVILPPYSRIFQWPFRSQYNFPQRDVFFTHPYTVQPVCESLLAQLIYRDVYIALSIPYFFISSILPYTRLYHRKFSRVNLTFQTQIVNFRPCSRPVRYDRLHYRSSSIGC